MRNQLLIKLNKLIFHDVLHREPITIDPIKSYKKAYYVGTDSKEAGILQAKILIDKWNTR